jgi:CubicO group peptidase (beta-lactamase class C family)
MSEASKEYLEVERVLDGGLASMAYGGAVAAIVRAGTVAATWAVGDAQRWPNQRAMRLDTIFDLASLTKVIAGANAILLLVDRGLLALDGPVAKVIPAFAAHGKHAVTVRHILTHTTGLPAWFPLYTQARDAEEALAVLCDMPLEGAPGTRASYSDLGPALIRFIVERVSGEQLNTFVKRELFEPLGMHETCWQPPPELRRRCAATESGNPREEREVALAGLSFTGWRREMLVGEVHDGNAHHAFGGVSAHAGLFSTASDLARFASMYLASGAAGGKQILSEHAVTAATTQAPGTPPGYGLGWRLNVPLDGEPPLFMGRLASPRAFGHTGFTGTSLVIDPARNLAMILLTNAIHTDPERTGIAAVRTKFHDAVVAARG